MAKTLFKQFSERIDHRFAADSSVMTTSAWIARNTKMRSRPFSFKGYEFQTRIVDDMHPVLCVKKCSQVGLTEVQVRKFLSMLKRRRGVSGIYTLPDGAMQKRVAQTRIKPILDDNKAFKSFLNEDPVRSMFLFQIDYSFGYVNGMTEGEATSIPADFLFHDEKDLSDQTMLGLYQSRLQNSDLKITQNFGTPTYNSFGISADYDSSDQHVYLLKCPRCNHHNIPEFALRFIGGLEGEWPEDLTESPLASVLEQNPEALYLRCERCAKAVDPGDPEIREWVPTLPRRYSRGYHVTPFCTGRIGVPYIWRRLGEALRSGDGNDMRNYRNTVLGIEGKPGDGQLSREQIVGQMVSGVEPQDRDAPVWIGIDQGIICHLVLGTDVDRGHMIFHFETVAIHNLVERVLQLRDRYTIIRGSMDRHPQSYVADKLYEATGGLIVPTEYHGRSGTAKMKSLLIQNLDGQVTETAAGQVMRSMMLDRVFQGIVKKTLWMTGFEGQKEVIINHLRNNIREEVPDKPIEFKKISNQDHYFHAIGFELFSQLLDEVESRSEADPRSHIGYTECTMAVPPGLLDRKWKKEGGLWQASNR